MIIKTEKILDYNDKSYNDDNVCENLLINNIIESYDLNNFNESSKNEPTDTELWSKIQKLVDGKVSYITHDGERIEGPNDGEGFKVHPSAYSNAWASKMYKKLGGSWKKAKKNESYDLNEKVYKNSGLGKWFGEDWVDISREDDEGHPECGASSDSGSRGKDGKRAYPKCVKSSKADSMSKDDKESATRRKREKGKPLKGEPRNVKTDVSESDMYSFCEFDISYINEKNNDLLSDKLGIVLDIAGFIPGAGELADLANAARYIKKGEFFNAALSIVSLIPEAGDIPAKLVKYGAKLSKLKGGKKAGSTLSKIGGNLSASEKFKGAEQFAEKTKELVSKTSEFLKDKKPLIDGIFDSVAESENEWVKKNIHPHIPAMKKAIANDLEKNIIDSVSESLFYSKIININLINEIIEDLNEYQVLQESKKKKQKKAKDPISGKFMTWPASSFFGYGVQDEIEDDSTRDVVDSGGMAINFGDTGSDMIFNPGPMGTATVGGE